MNCTACDAVDIDPLPSMTEHGIRRVCPKCSAFVAVDVEERPAQSTQTQPRAIASRVVVTSGGGDIIESVRARMASIDVELERLASLRTERKRLAAMLRAAERAR